MNEAMFEKMSSGFLFSDHPKESYTKIPIEVGEFYFNTFDNVMYYVFSIDEYTIRSVNCTWMHDAVCNVDKKLTEDPNYFNDKAPISTWNYMAWRKMGESEWESDSDRDKIKAKTESDDLVKLEVSPRYVKRFLNAMSYFPRAFREHPELDNLIGKYVNQIKNLRLEYEANEQI